MKKLVIVIVMALVLSSCNKWLEVQPKGQSTEKEIFSSSRGFEDALTGAYIRLSSGNLYGGDLSWGAIEFMALNWDLDQANVNSGNNALRNSDYRNDGAIQAIEGIFGGLYKVVADANGILTHIDEKESIFEVGKFELIKGEALALRALAHFEAMRTFGPIPNNPTSKKWLPYVKTITKDIHDGLTYNEFMPLVLKDLDEAEALLKKSDPVLKYTFAQLKRPKVEMGSKGILDDDFLLDRHLRMNYYAVQALKARVYQWLAESNATYQKLAFDQAVKIIDLSKGANQSLRLGVGSDRVAGDYTWSTEHIFGVHVFNLASRYNGLFGETSQFFRYDFDPYFYLYNLFPKNDSESDIRFRDMWSRKLDPNKRQYILYKKYFQKEQGPLNTVPLIRLSEMYLIATEFATSKEQAEMYYREYCGAKGIVFPTGFSTSGGWEGDRRNKLIREYVREFYAEGKTFFNYKRLDIKTLPASWAYPTFIGSEKRYIVTKPENEIDYNIGN